MSFFTTLLAKWISEKVQLSLLIPDCSFIRYSRVSSVHSTVQSGVVVVVFCCLWVRRGVNPKVIIIIFIVFHATISPTWTTEKRLFGAHFLGAMTSLKKSASAVYYTAIQAAHCWLLVGSFKCCLAWPRKRGWTGISTVRIQFKKDFGSPKRLS